MKIAIIGANGFLGKKLKNTLLKTMRLYLQELME